MDETGINKILYCFIVVRYLLKNFLLSIELCWYWSNLGKFPFFSHVKDSTHDTFNFISDKLNENSAKSSDRD